jgi:hypothetical protein
MLLRSLCFPLLPQKATSLGSADDLIVTKTGLTWCKGATRREIGTKATWDKFIEWMEARDR